ncbi:MAG: hypothetical protein Q8927_18305 [Bacteroidota bacterium]|nr:hypothetical protein [Bacteroidota bacterium]
MSFIGAFHNFLIRKDNDINVKFHGVLEMVNESNGKVARLKVNCGNKKFDFNDIEALKAYWIEFVATQDGLAEANALTIDGTTTHLATITTFSPPH